MPCEPSRVTILSLFPAALEAPDSSRDTVNECPLNSVQTETCKLFPMDIPMCMVGKVRKPLACKLCCGAHTQPCSTNTCLADGTRHYPCIPIVQAQRAIASVAATIWWA